MAGLAQLARHPRRVVAAFYGLLIVSTVAGGVIGKTLANLIYRALKRRPA